MYKVREIPILLSLNFSESLGQINPVKDENVLTYVKELIFSVPH